jgi:hypothetical protein
MDEWRLYLGTKPTGIVVRPDEKYPSMYRVHWPDRLPSDLVNLARAKEAAMRWAGRAGSGDSLRLNWKQSKSPPEAVRDGLKPTGPSPDAQAPLPAFPGPRAIGMFPAELTGCTGPAA